jgi:hypothetical protein
MESNGEQVLLLLMTFDEVNVQNVTQILNFRTIKMYKGH